MYLKIFSVLREKDREIEKLKRELAVLQARLDLLRGRT
jgi:hypothetical protein